MMDSTNYSLGSAICSVCFCERTTYKRDGTNYSWDSTIYCGMIPGEDKILLFVRGMVRIIVGTVPYIVV